MPQVDPINFSCGAFISAQQGNTDSGLQYWKQVYATTCGAKPRSTGNHQGLNCCNKIPVCGSQQQICQGGMSSQTFMNAKLQEYSNCNNQQDLIDNVVNQSSPENKIIIENIIQSELAIYSQNRFVQYKPYIPPVVPPALTEELMRNANAGIPHSITPDCNNGRYGRNPFIWKRTF